MKPATPTGGYFDPQKKDMGTKTPGTRANPRAQFHKPAAPAGMRSAGESKREQFEPGS